MKNETYFRKTKMEQINLLHFDTQLRKPLN